jgi:hypothetical protein
LKACDGHRRSDALGFEDMREVQAESLEIDRVLHALAFEGASRKRSAVVFDSADDVQRVRDRIGERLCGGQRRTVQRDALGATAGLARAIAIHANEIDDVAPRSPRDLDPPKAVSTTKSPGDAPIAPAVDELLSGLNDRRLSEREVRAALERHATNQEAAAALGVTRHALGRFMKKHGIRRP